MDKAYKFTSKYFILTSIYMKNQSISKAKMIIILCRPFVPWEDPMDTWDDIKDVF